MAEKKGAIKEERTEKIEDPGKIRQMREER